MEAKLASAAGGCESPGAEVQAASAPRGCGAAVQAGSPDSFQEPGLGWEGMREGAVGGWRREPLVVCRWNVLEQTHTLMGGSLQRKEAENTGEWCCLGSRGSDGLNLGQKERPQVRNDYII